MYQEISIIENNDKLTTRLRGIFEKEKDYIFNCIDSQNVLDLFRT